MIGATIWKYPLTITDEQDVMMPEGAEILSIDVQNGVLCIWAIVERSALKKPRTVLIFGTDAPVPPGNRFVGTVAISRFVWHVFEKIGNNAEGN